MIFWFVDDNKVLHIDEEVHTNIIETIPNFFLTHQNDKGKNIFLVMYMELLVSVKVSLFMKYKIY